MLPLSQRSTASLKQMCHHSCAQPFLFALLSDLRAQVIAAQRSLQSGLLPALALPRAPSLQHCLCFLCGFAQEAAGQASHSTLLETLAWAGMGTAVASSQLEQLASCQSGHSVPCAGGTVCPSPGLEGALRSLTVASSLSSFALCQQLVAMMALFLILFFRKDLNSKKPLPLRFSKITDQAQTPFPYSPAC